MVFSSTVFMFIFLPITWVGYYLLKKEYRNFWLLLVSLIFFAWSQPNYLWLLLTSIVINYIGARGIDITKSKTVRKLLLACVMFGNLGMLFYFKYFDFVIASINELFNLSFEIRNIILPIGISFFTFQGMSYVIEVYRKNVAVQKNPFKLAMYIVLFPQLIAGPIVRYSDVAKEIDRRESTIEEIEEGIERFIIGLGKKAILANTLALMVDTIWKQGAGDNTVSVAWLGSIAYSLQIYFDFSGYSDMAIGLGRMFGFHFSENFDHPYMSKSITEFWRRWHISLSSWFRDYVYIPLGGNRKHVYVNLAIVFILTGIWHGAAWNFVLWGMWHGFFMLVERAFKSRKKECSTEVDGGLKGVVAKSFIKTLIARVYTILVVNLGWVLFRAENIQAAKEYFKSMFGISDNLKPIYSSNWYLDKYTLCILLIALIGATDIPKRIWEKAVGRINYVGQTCLRYVLLLLLLLLALMRIVAGTYNPFIYFQF